MKNIFFAFTFLIASTSFAQYPLIKIGDQLPASNEKMECAVSNKSGDLQSLSKENGLIVIFSCNTCPFVVAWEDRYHLVNTLAEENNIGFVLVNSNFMKRDGADSWEAMQEHAKTNKYSWPYLFDNESAVANAFGAQTTPHVFLFNSESKLVYKGAIDDNHKDADDVKQFYLKDAIENLVSGKEIELKETRNLGCSIKRKI